MNMFVIGDTETCLAFALAGIRGRVVDSDTEAPSVLAGLNRREIALVLITQSLAEKNRELIERMLLEPGGLLIIEIPSARGLAADRSSAGPVDRILSLLRR